MTDAARQRERERLEYIRECIGLVEEYARQGRVRFFEDPMLQDAVLWRLQTTADAASHLSDELKARHPQINWVRVRGFRNVAAHAYEDLMLERVWRVVETGLRPLKAMVEQELA